MLEFVSFIFVSVVLESVTHTLHFNGHFLGGSWLAIDYPSPFILANSASGHASTTVKTS